MPFRARIVSIGGACCAVLVLSASVPAPAQVPASAPAARPGTADREVIRRTFRLWDMAAALGMPGGPVPNFSDDGMPAPADAAYTAEEIGFLKESAASAKADFDRVKARFLAGRAGGEAHRLYATAAALSRAEARVAFAEGKYGSTVAWLEQAVAAAELHRQAVGQSFDAGTGSLTDLMAAGEAVGGTKAALARIRRRFAEAGYDLGKPPAGPLLDLKAPPAPLGIPD